MRCERCGKFASRLTDIHVWGTMPQDGPVRVCDRCLDLTHPVQVETTDVSTEDQTIIMVGPSREFYGSPVELHDDEDRNEDD